MSLNTFSSFYYGYEVTRDNNLLPFDEGDGELNAVLTPGTYTLSDFTQLIATAMTTVSVVQPYTATVNRSTRVITIQGAASFTLLAGTGSTISSSIFLLAGFNAANKTGTSLVADNASGSSYRPQHILQDHVPTDKWRQAASSTVNKTATGRVELIKFGDEQFMQGNIKFITNIPQPGGFFENNVTGEQDAIDFMEWIRDKNAIEYMPDRDSPNTFEKFVLESTPQSKDGTGYKLKENYDIGLPGYFETGILVFRKVV